MQVKSTCCVSEVGTYTLFHSSAMLSLKMLKKCLRLISLPSRTPDPNPVLGLLQHSLSRSSKHALLLANHNCQKCEGMLFWAEPGQFPWPSEATLQQCKMHSSSTTHLSIFSNFVLTVPFFLWVVALGNKVIAHLLNKKGFCYALMMCILNTDFFFSLLLGFSLAF